MKNKITGNKCKRWIRVNLTHLIIHILCTVSVLAVEIVAAIPHSSNKLKKKPSR